MIRQSRPHSNALRLHALVLLLGLVAFGAAPAAAGPATSDTLSFSTEGQSLWGPGPEEIQVDDFRKVIVDQRTGRRTEGDIVTVENPAWRTAYNACRNNGLIDPGDSVCRTTANAAGPRSLGRFGVELTIQEAHFKFGIRGELKVESGSVDVDYATQARLEVLGEDFMAGDLVTILTGESPISGGMTTDFPFIEATMNADLDMGADVDVETRVAGVGGTVPIMDFDSGPTTQEIFGARIDPGAGDISLRVLDEEVYSFPEEGIAKNIKIKNLFPVADVALWVPKLDTPNPNGTTRFDNEDGRVDNDLIPGERLKIDFGFIDPNNQDTDFAKWDLDLDVLTLAKAMPAGAEVSIPNTATIEANVLDADFGAFHGISQQIRFQPELRVELAFSVPVEIVEPADQAGVSDVVMVRVGDPVVFRHPGGTVDVEPLYELGNTFVNDSHYYAAFAFTESFMQLKVKGKAVDRARGLGIPVPGNIAVFETQFDVGKPFPIRDLSEEFEMVGFEPVVGRRLTIREGVFVDTCGDGWRDAGEQCDDGNRMDGDGCDAFCAYELGCRGASCGETGTSQPLPGRKLQIVHDADGDIERAALAFSARTGLIDAPQPGSAGDPRCAAEGGSGADSWLTVVSDETGEAFQARLACEHWRLVQKDGKPRAWKYKDASGSDGACTKAILKDGKSLKIKCKGRDVGFELRKGRSEGTIRTWLDLGEDATWCAAFDARQGRDGSDGEVLKSKDSIAPVSCD